METEERQRFFNPDREPEPSEIETLLGKDASRRFHCLDAFLKSGYDALRELKFPFGSHYGWSYKYSSKGKMLCYVFFEKDAVTVTITIGKGDLPKLERELPQLLPRTRQLWENRYPCGGGGWIHYRLLIDDELQDVKKLICIKKKPKALVPA